MDFSAVIFAFLLTLFAGLSTGIGSALSLLTKKTNTKFLSIALGFSAGVMIYVSFVEIFTKAKDSLVAELGEVGGSWATVGAFFFGIFLIALIDKLIPDTENPHEIHTVEEMDGKSESHKANLMRMGMFTALAVGIHNFPEGLATFTAALGDPSLGIPIAVAIAIHNIPEGIAVAVPVFYATGSRKKAFRLSLLSGLSEPVGALIGYLLLYRFFNDITFGLIFASVAGIMVYISLDELLPAAREYGEHHLSIYGLIAGMAVMALSLLLFI
ncbi:zinc transporter ZupT [Herbinix luporum]|jgi:ZIP family zinc transporter|uniref:Zinc transporter ZupT n=1 Tax=Herbinix luporum TaxID=1679721 RepID=A0A0K8J5W1_9FIRM|nr:zinc transporter ZupT [Herbinix luporum]CUH92744.1 Zinc transporter ZupT [Herbinix luporum]HHT57900.1 zinc transporter ZupT [Herbinix luporum]